MPEALPTVKRRKYPELKRDMSVKTVRIITIFGRPKRFVQEGWVGTVTETSRNAYVRVEWPDLGGATFDVPRDAIKVIPKPF